MTPTVFRSRMLSQTGARGEFILELFVGGHAVSGFLLRQAPQALGGLEAGLGHRRAHPVHLGLTRRGSRICQAS